jgi:CDP-diacylglycerol--serine O-phosphatidyltransferase
LPRYNRAEKELDMPFVHRVPNLITLFHLLLGAWGIAEALHGRLLYACWLGLIAVLLDWLDGLSARLLKATSERGRQLDSLADLVSFGVLPAVVLQRLLWMSHANWQQLLYLGSFPMVSFLAYLGIAAAAWRLAGFNLQKQEQTYFLGLPTPAHALFVLSLPLMVEYGVLIVGEQTIVFLRTLVLDNTLLIPACFFTPALMVAPLRMHALKPHAQGFRRKRAVYLSAVLGAALIAAFGFTSLPFLVMAYIIVSLVNKPQP